MNHIKIPAGITTLIGASVLLLTPLDAAAHAPTGSLQACLGLTTDTTCVVPAAAATRVDSPARVGFNQADVADRASTAPVELSFDTPFDPTNPGLWVGTVAGDITGTLQTRMTDLRVSGPTWHVRFEWTITPANTFASRPGAPLDVHQSQTTMTSGQSFVADLTGVLNIETRAVVMNGTVVEGYLLGAQLHEVGQLIDADTLRLQGTIQVTADDALTTDAGGTSG